MDARVALLGLMVLAAEIGCGGSRTGAQPDGGSTDGPVTTSAQVSRVRGPDGTDATYHTGSLPAPSGTIDVTVPPSGTAINGGSTMINVESTSTIVKIYISIQGSDGYWTLTVPPGSTVAEVLLTLAQQLPAQLVIVFEVADAAGNISAPATVVTTIVQVKTGDIQVSVSWDVDNDIDLHVVDPNGFEVYYGDTLSPEEGELDLDSNAACLIDSVDNENILWPIGKAPAGTYTVRVDNFENCNSQATNYVVTVQKKGQAPQTFMGSFAATDLGDGGDTGAGVTITTFTYP
jgi:hypothetical protein